MDSDESARQEHDRLIMEIQTRAHASEGPFLEISLTHPASWKSQSEHFFAVAQLLWKTKNNLRANPPDWAEHEYMIRADPLGRGSSEYFMLGLALELLFKATWFAKHPKVFTIAPQWWKGASGHNLSHLADSVGFKLTKEERRELENLTEFVVSISRYPSSFKKKNATRHAWTVTWKDCVAIYDRLLPVYEAAWISHFEARKPR